MYEIENRKMNIPKLPKNRLFFILCYIHKEMSDRRRIVSCHSLSINRDKVPWCWLGLWTC